jgi:hypothetical protein
LRAPQRTFAYYVLRTTYCVLRTDEPCLAGEIIEAEYPHITWSPCAAHVCDLALEDIFKLDFFKELHTATKGFVAFITNHHHTLAAWRAHQAAARDGKVLQLIKPGETRFASALLMIERTLKVKDKLQQFVVCDLFNDAVSTMKPADKVRCALQLLCCSTAGASAG